MRNYFIALMGVFTFLLIACKDPIPDPEQTTLLAPEDNTSCLYVSQNSTTATVDFSWEEADFTDEYRLVIRNLTTGEESTSITENTSIRLTLTRGVPYQWKVISTSELSTVETSSTSFSFYLEAQQQTNYLPFPARLLSPQQDEMITLSEGAYLFAWEGADLDNDIAFYSLLIGPTIEGLSEIQTNLPGTTFTASLNPGELYFWQIITHDQNANATKSLPIRFETAP